LKLKIYLHGVNLKAQISLKESLMQLIMFKGKEINKCGSIIEDY
jgi:hypothetical protein